MSKAAEIIFVQSIITLVIGLILTANGLPSDEVDVATTMGSEALNQINQTVEKDQYTSSLTTNSKQAFFILGMGATIISSFELIISGIAIFKSVTG